MKNGFENPQADDHPGRRQWGSCGAHAVYHALLCLGVVADKNKFKGPFPCGLGQGRLERLAKRHGGLPIDISVTEEQGLGQLRKRVNRHLDQGRPIIVSCEYDEDDEIYWHWIVLAGRSGNIYYWIDSADDDLAGATTWTDLEDYIGAADPGAFALATCTRGAEEHSLVPSMENLWELLSVDSNLANNWSDYLEDLYRLCDFGRTPGRTMPIEDFFRNNKEAIVQPVIWEDDELEEDGVRDEYDNYSTVGSMHNLVLPRVFESHAVAHMTLLLREQVS